MTSKNVKSKRLRFLAQIQCFLPVLYCFNSLRKDKFSCLLLLPKFPFLPKSSSLKAMSSIKSNSRKEFFFLERMVPNPISKPGGLNGSILVFSLKTKSAVSKAVIFGRNLSKRARRQFNTLKKAAFLVTVSTSKHLQLNNK